MSETKAKVKQIKQTVRIAVDTEELAIMLVTLTPVAAQYPELIKKLQLAKFKAENEISTAYVKTGRKPTQAQELLDSFDESSFMESIKQIEIKKTTGEGENE